MCVYSTAPDLCVTAPRGRLWSLQLLVPAKTQQALKSQAHNMHTGFTAGADLNCHRDTQPAAASAETPQSHTCTYKHQPGRKDARLQCLITSKWGGNLTVKAWWIVVDSQQETSNCWLFLFCGWGRAGRRGGAAHCRAAGKVESGSESACVVQWLSKLE